MSVELQLSSSCSEPMAKGKKPPLVKGGKNQRIFFSQRPTKQKVPLVLPLIWESNFFELHFKKQLQNEGRRKLLPTGRGPGQWRKENEKTKGKFSAGCLRGGAAWAGGGVVPTLSLILVKISCSQGKNLLIPRAASLS